MQKMPGLSEYKFSIKRNSSTEFLSLYLFKNTKSTSDIVSFEEVSKLMASSWGDFPEAYITSSIFKAYLLCIIRNSKDELISIAPLKRLTIMNRVFYSFGLTAVHPRYRKLNLLKKMGFALGKRIIWETLSRGRLIVELVFITPNILTLGTISKISSFIYPDPYVLDKVEDIPEADDETWKIVREFLRKSGESYRALDRKGCIMEGFYDDKEKLIISEKLKHTDKVLEEFGKKYLYDKPGKEAVIRAKINIISLLRYV